MQNLTIIGLDHGYGNMKTAHFCFPCHVIAHGKEDPGYKQDTLLYDGNYYTLGMGHKEFMPDKIADDDFYILTLAALARELQYRVTVNARVFLGVGLPLTWVGSQKEELKAYLLGNKEVDFTCDGIQYHIEFAGAELFPQGASAIATRMHEFGGVNVLADIGNGTMNIMYIVNGKPDRSRCYTEKLGTYQCMLAVSEELLKRTGKRPHEATIEEILRNGVVDDIPDGYQSIVQEVAAQYVESIFSKLREHEYDADTMRLIVVGGGGCLIKNFGDLTGKRVEIIDDIHATAKGYEKAAQLVLEHRR